MKKSIIGGGLIAFLFIVVFITVAKTKVNRQTDTDTSSVSMTSPQNTIKDGLSPVARVNTKYADASKPAPSTAGNENTNKLIPFVLNELVKDKFELFIAECAEQAPLAVQIAYVNHSLSTHTKETHDYAIDLFSRFVTYKVALASEDVDIDVVQSPLNDIQEKLDAR